LLLFLQSRAAGSLLTRRAALGIRLFTLCSKQKGGGMAINYLMIGSNDLARSRIFYDAVMSHLGGVLEHDYPGMAFGYTLASGQAVWVALPYNKEPAVAANGTMPGFGCASKDIVNAVHAAALANGGSNEGDPGPRPLYGPDFYGAYVRDPDGNKMSFILA
jgi:catechol 2,3-dioxygenase-like lactoylglutathione lyase family enzyme